MKKRIVCGSICIAILLALAIFTLVGLNQGINNRILDGVVLLPQTYDLWGANPGKSGTLTLRNFTFYNFTNPRGYLYRGQIPKFTQISNFAYQQRSNFTNHVYNEDYSIVNFDYWLYFTILQSSRNVNQTVTVMNLAPLGFWNQLDTVDISALAIQGFGGLFVEMNNTIKIQAIGQGIKGQYLQQVQNWLIYCKNLEFSQSFCMFVWFDPLYGLNDQNNYQPWIKWFYLNDRDAGIALVEHFGFSQYQITGLNNLFKQWSQSLNGILGNWYCQGVSCESYELTLMQLGKGGLTSNPPTGDPVDSICDSGNITCEGYPQLYSFYKHVFLPKNKQKVYENLDFSRNTVKQLFTPYRGTLLNVGNLSELYKVGQVLQSDRNNKNLLEKLTKITHAETEHHAWVIWKYAKYFVEQFVIKTEKKGQRKIAGMAGVFTQALYQSITQFSDWFISQFISLIVAQQIPNCNAFLSKIDTIDKATAKNLCQNVNSNNYLNYYQLVHPCLNPLLRPDFKQKYNLRGIQIEQLCDPYKESLLTVANLAHHAIYKQYKCSSNPTLQRCTPFEIGAKQFFNSQITLKPLQTQIKAYSAALSGKSWNKELQEFEYRNYLNQAYGNSWVDKQTFDDPLQQADILSFDKFYSVPGVQDLLIEKNATKLQEKYYWKNATLLLGYMRFLVIEVGFGGLVQKRSAHQLLFGYEDDFLKNLKEMDPMMGGDPSIESIIMLNEPNSTLEQAVKVPQAMYTGFYDPYRTRNYVSNRNKPYVTFNKTRYTGYQVISQQVNPFKNTLKLKGTDAFQNLPMSTAQDNQYIYIDTLYRIAQMNFTNQQSKYGFDLLRYKLSNNSLASQSDFKPNENFYQPFKGLMNLSFLGLPLFASQSHFYESQPYWLERVQMYDESEQYKQLPNKYDQCYLVTEPKSGVTFQALLYLQTNLYVSPDILLQIKPAMLPVFTIYRGANLTQSAANDVLGDLKIALAAPRYILIFCIAGILLIVVSIVCCVMRGKKKKQAIPSLLESTDNVFDQEISQKVKKNQTQVLPQQKYQQPEVLIRQLPKQQQPLRVPLNQSLQAEEQIPKPVEKVEV